ncbi:MAG: hypothetical protein J6M34_01730 [Clostridia bacterium]|nr:hypothetical protein [Clostridia bacterium]
MEMNSFRNNIITDAANDLAQFAKAFGFSSPVIKNDGYTTKIYIIKKHAIQFEIDWRELEIFMFVVRLLDNKIPPKNVVYQYENGESCRTYVEEIYQIKNPIYKNTLRYTESFLSKKKNFYMQLIQSDPQRLFSYMSQL